MRYLITLLSALLGLGLIAGCGEADSEVTDIETFEVGRGDLELRLTETGSLEARNKVDIRPITKAQILEIVDQGTHVKKGDVLVKLDAEATENEIEKFESQVTQLKADLKNAESDLKIQIGENQSNFDKAMMNKEFAEKELERYMEGDYKQQKRDLEMKITQMRSRLDLARDKYEKMPELQKKGFATKNEVEEKRIAVEKADADFEAAKLSLELFIKYSNPMSVRRKESDVTEAEREIERVKERAEARIEAKNATLSQKKLQYDRAVERLAEKKELLKGLTIFAPQDGMVIYGGRRNRWGGKEGEPEVGGMTFPGQTLIELPDLSKMDVGIRVHQADIRKLRIGQKAWVALPQRGSKRYEAKVSEIGSVASSGGWRDQVKRFDVKVQITEDVEGQRAGVTVEVQVELGRLENVIQVPLQCVSPYSGGFSVYVKEDGEVKRRRVRLGKTSDQFVEVKSGLEEGERVLLVNPDVVSDDEEADKKGNGGGGRPGGRPEGGGQPKRPSGGGKRPSGTR